MSVSVVVERWSAGSVLSGATAGPPSLPVDRIERANQAVAASRGARDIAPQDATPLVRP